MSDLTEKQYLIQRALDVFNRQYGAQIQPETCEIVSINNDIHSNRGYAITTPNGSQTLRIHLYVVLAGEDQKHISRLEVAMPYRDNALGDEIWVIHIAVDRWYRDSNTYRFDIILANEVPENAFVAEYGFAFQTEDGAYITTE